MTKKVAALQDVTACRLVLMDQRFRETRCYCEKPVHVNQNILRHMTIISFVNYAFGAAKMPHRHYSFCGKHVLVHNGHLVVRIRIFIEKPQATSPCAGQDIPCILWMSKFITAFTRTVTGHYSQTDESIPYPPNMKIVHNN